MTGSKIVINGKSVEFGTIYVNSSGAELLIVVTAPTGSTVTASKDGKVYTTPEDSGTWNIKVPEYGTYTVKATLGDNSAEESVDVAPEEVTLSYGNIFGVMWDYSNPSTALTRLTPENDPQGYVNTTITEEPTAAVGISGGSSPFDNYMPWAGMEQYNILPDDTIIKRGEDGFSQTQNDTMVWIPEYYYAVVDVPEESKRYWYISDKACDGFEKHPGSGRYVGRYDTGGGYVSKSNLAPLTGVTRDQARKGSHAKGYNWWQYDYATYCAIWLLYLVEYADWDTQKTIGRGLVDSANRSNSGSTDAMKYHTGQPAGINGKTAIQYRSIENIYGNCLNYVDGININSRKIYISLNNDAFKDDTIAEYANTNATLPTSSGFITKISYSDNCKWSFLPISSSGGSNTTYIPDNVRPPSATSYAVLLVGGDNSDTSEAGIFYFFASQSSTSSQSYSGSRLIYIPKGETA